MKWKRGEISFNEKKKEHLISGKKKRKRDRESGDAVVETHENKKTRYTGERIFKLWEKRKRENNNNGIHSRHSGAKLANDHAVTSSPRCWFLSFIVLTLLALETLRLANGAILAQRTNAMEPFVARVALNPLGGTRNCHQEIQGAPRMGARLFTVGSHVRHIISVLYIGDADWRRWNVVILFRV